MSRASPSFKTFLTPGKRVLLKLSGEALLKGSDESICLEKLQQLAEQVAFLKSKGIQVGIVIGGGNFFRGAKAATKGFPRVTADHMGMMATVMNGIALRDILKQQDISSTLMSAVEIPSIAKAFCTTSAQALFEQQHTLIFVMGTGSPYFTTDTAAVLRALETRCDLLLKGTQVDGIYSHDPKKHNDATFYPLLTYQDILHQNLRVMDLTAITLAQENHLPLVIFSLQSTQPLQKVWQGNQRCSWVLDKEVPHV